MDRRKCDNAPVLQSCTKRIKYNLESEIGKTYGSLTILHFTGFRQTPSRRNIPMMECRCVCGTIKNVSHWDLRQSKTKTCGFNHPHYADRSVPALNVLFKDYQIKAAQRSLVFAIPRELFEQMVVSDCYYCESEPQMVKRQRTGNGISEFRYNGIDRMDNARGYTVDNVVPCCFRCNRAKYTYSHDEFIAHCVNVALTRAKEKLYFVPIPRKKGGS